MNTSLFLRLLPLLILSPAHATDGGSCPATCLMDSAASVITCAASSPTDGIKRHPLRGVVMAVNAERSALMVKHEEIPGVMKAMTMMFRVDSGALKSVQKGQTITGLMSRQGNEWVLEDVKVVAAK